MRINIEKIRERCLQSTPELFNDLQRSGYQRYRNHDRDHEYMYLSRGADVLVVAHADSVQSTRLFEHNGDRIMSPQLDDRLGVAICTDILEDNGIICDVLITDQEESANSSARSFHPDKNYNWIVEFDRGGTDAVTYCYDSPEWIDAIGNVWPDVGHGIYSDIVDMEDIGISAFNVGIGYHNYHSMNAFADLGELELALNRFRRFYHANKSIAYAHEYFVDRNDFVYKPLEECPICYSTKTSKGFCYECHTQFGRRDDSYNLLTDCEEDNREFLCDF